MWVLLQRAVLSEHHGDMSGNVQRLIVKLGNEVIEKGNFCGTHFRFLSFKSYCSQNLSHGSLLSSASEKEKPEYCWNKNCYDAVVSLYIDCIIPLQLLS